jgi:hydrogenase maturation protein HypF
VMRMTLRVRGVVQGVGFRPFVRRAALARGLGGWVRNDRDGVHIEASGSEAELHAFLTEVRDGAPPPAEVHRVDVQQTPSAEPAREQTGLERFAIVASGETSEVAAVLPPDLAPCDACLAEVADPSARRHRYPFTNCTRCGPRYSIVQELPYDRDRTTMAAFAMCDRCRAEFEALADRRYHAQPIACPDCGPQLEFVEAKNVLAGEAALLRAGERLRDGDILALRGVGGFQLLVDAIDDDAVRRLRARKGRPDKPLAVLFASADAVAEHARVDEAARAALQSVAAPIVLLPRLAASTLAPSVHGASPWLGAMLPASPLHHLLAQDVARPLVCTSGNRSGEPMLVDDEQAREMLGEVADVFLTHDRAIVRPVDDSIVRVMDGQPMPLRRGRGYAPLPIVQVEGEDVLAFGAHLKSTVAVASRGWLHVSQHLGDLDSPRGEDLLAATVDDLCRFVDARPTRVACDRHPDYASTRLAERFAAKHGLPLHRIQHHHAHVAAVMAEHRIEGEVLGFAWDGTGLGDDDSIWGGEAFVCQGASRRRVDHIGRFRLPSGDGAARRPRRAALGLLAAAGVDPQALGWFDDRELATLTSMITSGTQAPWCTSMGRLFDAVAALAGVADHCTYEGQAALALEAAALRAASSEHGEYPGLGNIEAFVAALCHDLRAGRDASIIARRFHSTVIAYALDVAAREACQDVVLSGGCFANTILAGELSTRLTQAGHRVFMGRALPPSDNAIAAGQAWLAMQEGPCVPGHSR